MTPGEIEGRRNVGARSLKVHALNIVLTLRLIEFIFSAVF